MSRHDQHRPDDQTLADLDQTHADSDQTTSDSDHGATISSGLAQLEPDETLEALIARADRELQSAGHH